MKKDTLTISNVVGGGGLEREVNLAKVYEDINNYDVQYDPENHPGLIVRFQDPKATIMLYTSGKYSIAGSNSYDDTREANQKFISIIEDLFGENIESKDFDIRFVVCTGDLGFELDLNEVMLGLGIGNVEYEPEQFPGLFYRPENEQWFALLFRTGKIILNGDSNIEVLKNGYKKILEELDVQDDKIN